MNEIEIDNIDLDYMRKLDCDRFIEWVDEELKLNSKYSFHNRDFNKLPGFTYTIVFNLDLKESKRCLNDWILEEVFLNPGQEFNKDLLRKLPINVNNEGE